MAPNTAQVARSSSHADGLVRGFMAAVGSLSVSDVEEEEEEEEERDCPDAAAEGRARCAGRESQAAGGALEHVRPRPQQIAGWR